MKKRVIAIAAVMTLLFGAGLTAGAGTSYASEPTPLFELPSVH